MFAAGADPYERWMRHGAGEGRLPCNDPLSFLDSLMREGITDPQPGSERRHRNLGLSLMVQCLGGPGRFRRQRITNEVV